MAAELERDWARAAGHSGRRSLPVAVVAAATAMAGYVVIVTELTVLPSLLWLPPLAIAAAILGAALVKIAQGSALTRDGLDAVAEPHFVSNGAGRVLYANAACRRLFPGGASPLAALRVGLADDRARTELDRLAEGAGGSALLPARLRGEAAWFAVSATKLKARDRMLWRIADVSEVETQRRDWRCFFDGAPVGLYSLDQDGRFHSVNQAFASWLGASAAELVGTGAQLHSFIWSDPARRAEFDPLAPLDGFELSLRGAGGVPVDIALDQAVVETQDGQRTVSIVRNLARERQAGMSGSSRERFQRFFELAPVGIALIDSNGNFKETNRALDELLTDSREPVLDRPFIDYLADDAIAEVKTRLAAVSAGEPAGRPIETKLKEPGAKTVALFVSRLEGADRKLAGLILHFIDLTDQKKLEQQFAQAHKMQAVGQLAGGVAHDFNNLLTAMIGFCDLLLLRFRPGDQSFADIMQIKQNANRAANLVRQLLAFSRQQTLQPRVIQIGEVLSELSHLLNRLLGENVELKMMHGRNIGPVRVDQGQLEQVIINLAVNARDAMPQGGTLTIRTSNLESREPFQRELEIMPPGAYVLIEVTDNGTGIPRNIIGRIFEPFFSTKEVGSGTGLGLSTVYGIVKQTGGFIFVESELGKGTKFSIYLPRHNDAETAGRAKSAADSGDQRAPQDLTGSGTVLLVEDEDPVRMFSARALRNKGYTVLEAKSGEAALKIIAEGAEPIDMIITDVVMPRMDGPTLIKQVREAMPEVKVIFISGYTEDTFRKRLDNEQGIHFLAKPFSLKQLATKVKETMAGSIP
jgi:two-component system cell cycle sensor histidine kinase/response regulator CckA